MSGRSLSWYVLVLVVAVPAFAQRIVLTEDAAPAARFSAGIVAGANGVAPVEVSVAIPSVDIEADGNGFDKVTVTNLSPLATVGAPDLYETGSLIAVPEGYAPALTVVNEEVRELADVTVRPAQREMRCDGRNDGFGFSSRLYASGGIFPAQAYALEEVGWMQNVHFMRVAVRPLQMDFAHRRLRVTTNLRLRVDFRPTGANVSPSYVPKTIARIARASAVNAQGLNGLLRPAAGPETMIVVTADTLKDAIQPFIAWKRAKGLRVEVVTVSEAGGTNEKIKTFLQKYYDDHQVKPTYLIFVGNQKTMPPFMEEVKTSDDGPAATDYRYAIFTRKDPIPDALYGRILANDAKEVATQVTRLIDYEKRPEKNSEWYAQGTTLASSQGFAPSDEQYAQQVEEILKKNTYKGIDRFYQKAKTATNKNINKAIDEGRSWVTYFGHGSGTSWASTNERYSVREIQRLTNKRLPIIIDVACDNASYTVHTMPFGKAWVVQQTKDGKAAGAVSYYGASVSVSWHPPAIMAVGVAKAHYEKPVNTLGGSVLGGQLYLIEKKGTGVDVTDNLKWYNLFGDPSLLVRTAAPRTYEVKSKVERDDEKVTVSLHATDRSGKAVAGLLAAIQPGADDVPLAVGTTDAKGDAILEIPRTTPFPKETLLTVTGYNAETFEAKLPTP